MDKVIMIGCDNAAFGLKCIIRGELEKLGRAYEDVGVNDPADPTPYPEIARMVAEGIITSGYTKEGILLCGTGIGMAIAANKFRGIYAAVCHDSYSTERARLSNDTNIIAMGARVIGPELAKQLIRQWLGLEFVPGGSSPKIALIKEYERANFKQAF